MSTELSADKLAIQNALATIGTCVQRTRELTQDEKVGIYVTLGELHLKLVDPPKVEIPAKLSVASRIEGARSLCG